MKRKRYFLTFGLVFILLLIDQIVKIWVKSNFDFSDPSISLIGDWLQLNYVENQGMAFGTSLGGGMWGKLALSLFRVAAIVVGVVLTVKQINNKSAKTELFIVAGLILAGATGNLFDSMFYDYIFPHAFNPCLPYNQMHGSGIWMDCSYGGFTQAVEVRHRGFLFGNVVDMFQFNVIWPSWVPWVGGNQVFPAIWNIADASISVGVILFLFRQKVYFPNTKEKKEKTKEELDTTKEEPKKPQEKKEKGVNN